ncbi:MAG: Wadjet anti-phage system protein JetA family protein [Lachnospiraceae bacterium]|nr:Wadjet anti-phage system protein JetA family protein [Lachnospiraceae bacterium]
MNLFDRIPDKFFTILASSKKELYVQALFVLRDAFQSELQIRRDDLLAQLTDSLEKGIMDADFTEEAEEEDVDIEEAANVSGKAHLLLRKLKDTGWVETEYAAHSFEEYITIPDYAIEVINLLYDLTSQKTHEYNSYVYGTYAVLENADTSHSNYFFALQQAYTNTSNLVVELKSLFNNIKRYFQLVEKPGQDVNDLLHEHFDEYKTKIIDAVYYPLKTMDSVPRFKNSILDILNAWMDNEEIRDQIVREGVERRVFSSGMEGREETQSMLASTMDTYETIEEMIREIDRKHNEYTNASIDKIRYLINADQSAKGKLVDLLKHSGESRLIAAMEDNVEVFQHSFADADSLYEQVKRTRRSEGKPLAVAEEKVDPAIIGSFLEDVRKQYTNQKIDAYILDVMGDRESVATEEFHLPDTEDFILFLLGTIRGGEESSPFTVTFSEGNVDVDGWNLPRITFFMRKMNGE